MKVQNKLSTYIKLTGLVFVVFNAVYLSSSYLTNSFDDLDIFVVKGSEQVNVNHDSKGPGAEDEEEYEGTAADDDDGKSFGEKIKGLLKQVSKNKKKYWLTDTTLRDTEVTVDPRLFLNDASSDDAWKNKNTLFYDPRLTLSLYLDHMRRKFNDTAETEIEVPFHWVDWLDLTDMNAELSKPVEKRQTCEWVRQYSDVVPDIDFKDLKCIDRLDFSPRMLKNSGFDKPEQVPSFVSFDYSEPRAFHEVRLVQAKTYSMTFLPNPFKLIFLNQEGGTYEAKVEQGDVKRRIVKSGLMNDYLDARYREEGNTNSLKKLLKSIQLQTVTLNPVEEFRKLKSEVSPKFISEEEDLYHIHDQINNNSPILIPDDSFKYSREDIIKGIEKYEEMKKNKGLTLEQKNYYKSLEESTQLSTYREYTYFKMATLEQAKDKNNRVDAGWHYDWRFFSGGLEYVTDDWTKEELNERTTIILDRLTRNWFRFAAEKGIVSWIQHGPLLSWYWNGMMFPFDNDLDIQMPVKELLRLGEEYNQTLVIEDLEEGFGKYFIDVGTFIHNRVISRKSNHIDARFIDVDTGIYIDITGLGQSFSRVPFNYRNSDILIPPYDKTNMVNDRRMHFYYFDQISPLKRSMLFGVPVFIPNQIAPRLRFEYPSGMTSEEYRGWYFVSKLRLWVPQDSLLFLFKEEDYQTIQGDQKLIDKEKLKKLVSEMTDEQTYKLLLNNKEVLCEYYLTHELTGEHDQENKFLFKATEDKGKVVIEDNEKLQSDETFRQSYNKFASDNIKMHKPLRKSLFQYLYIDKPLHREERLAQARSM